MNKFTQDQETLQIQNHARFLAKSESEALDLFLNGKVSEDYYIKQMNATEEFVAFAISHGVHPKDLPAV